MRAQLGGDSERGSDELFDESSARRPLPNEVRMSHLM